MVILAIFNREIEFVFANYLAAPFVFGALTLLYLSWSVDADYAPWMIPLVLAAALVYIFQPQINWWYYSRRPRPLEPGLRDMLERFFPFYRRLGEQDRKIFRDRVVLFRMGTDWTPLGWDNEQLPPDVELAITAPAIALTLRMPEFLFPSFEKVVVYPGPFPSPEYPFMHASELYAPDGCLIFSARELMAGFLQPLQHYNIALHEYARAFVVQYPDKAFPVFAEEDIWETLQAVSGISRQAIEQTIGIAGVEPLPVAIHHYMVFQERFREALPDLAAGLDRIFNP